MSRRGKSIDTESRLVVAWGWEGLEGVGEGWYLKGTGVSWGDDENVLNLCSLTNH